MRLTIWNFLFFSLLLAALSACTTESSSRRKQAAEPAAPEWASSPYLWSVDTVRQLLQSDAAPLVLLEVNKEEKYLEEGHLPGALRIWRPDYTVEDAESYGGLRASREQMAALLGRLGIGPNSRIVLYDSKGNVDALRVWWLLQMYGHPQAYIMNGGKSCWQQEEYPLEHSPAPMPRAVTYRFPAPESPQRFAALEDVLASLRDTSIILLDTREPEEYAGAPFLRKGQVVPWKPGAFINGRIPGAIHLNWSDAVDLHGDHCFKRLADLKYNFEQAGLSPEKTIITYCQSGVRSAHTTFVLTELLGYPDVRNYDGSWIEWSYMHAVEGKVPVESDYDEAASARRIAELEAELQVQ